MNKFEIGEKCILTWPWGKSTVEVVASVIYWPSSSEQADPVTGNMAVNGSVSDWVYELEGLRYEIMGYEFSSVPEPYLRKLGHDPSELSFDELMKALMEDTAGLAGSMS